MKFPLKFPKSLRLKARSEFRRIAREGHRRVGRFICVDVRSAPSQRLGITASGRYGSSPERNRFKRLVREAFRTSREALPARAELHVVPRQGAKGAGYAHVRDELIKLCKG